MTLQEEFATRNFSIYGQWLGILSMILCLACGISTLITSLIPPHVLVIIISAIALASAFVILFIEVPLLLRICPTSSKFDAMIRMVSTNYMRAAVYAVMAIVQFMSIIDKSTALVAPAVFMSLTAICYLLAAIKGQAFVGSKTLGGAGVAQMIV